MSEAGEYLPGKTKASAHGLPQCHEQPCGHQDVTREQPFSSKTPQRTMHVTSNIKPMRHKKWEFGTKQPPGLPGSVRIQSGHIWVGMHLSKPVKSIVWAFGMEPHQHPILWTISGDLKLYTVDRNANTLNRLNHSKTCIGTPCLPDHSKEPSCPLLSSHPDEEPPTFVGFRSDVLIRAQHMS